MPLVQTRGAASAQGFGEFAQASGPANYIEDVFSCFLYTGNGATQTITNGIDLAGKGGLVWAKRRDAAAPNGLYDTTRGAYNYLTSNGTGAQSNFSPGGVTAFNSNGFSVADDTFGSYAINGPSGATYASWTFRKQAKFFDVVTYTGNGTGERAIAHNLGATPGCVIVKRTDSTAPWGVWHRGNGVSAVTYFELNTTAAGSTDASYTAFTSATTFTVDGLGPASTSLNTNGATYVAYLFAHDAGGFGLSGTDNVISCGSFTTDGSGNATVNLGYEPQWIVVKATNQAYSWEIYDTMRGIGASGTTHKYLYANFSSAESSTTGMFINSTGFLTANNYWGANTEMIYIAIRRGPMKVPTLGTSVFGLNARTGTGADATVTGGQTDDAVLVKNRGSAVASLFSSRLTSFRYLVTSSDVAEVAAGATILQANPWDVMDGVKVGTTSTITNASANTYINYLFRRAPSFFDVVCYTGTGSNTTITHNLGVAPELMIVKGRSGATAWESYCSALANTEYLVLSTTAAKATGATRWNSTTPTSSVFSIGTSGTTNTSAATYVAYLFATCAGVSKVFSYTGNGSSQTINCGFTAGSRWVMIKRTDSTGDWYVWDSARGIVAGNDPHLSLNDTAAEVTTDDSVDTDNTGFIVNQVAATNVNVTSATYIGLAIA